MAAEQYLQTTDKHFAKAMSQPTGTLQNALPTAAGDDRSGANKEKSDAGISPNVASLRHCKLVPVSPAGFVPTTYGLKGGGSETRKLLARNKMLACQFTHSTFEIAGVLNDRKQFCTDLV